MNTARWFRPQDVFVAIAIVCLGVLSLLPTRAAFAEEVGAVRVVVLDVYGRGGAERLANRDIVFFNERITTGSESAARIDLIDESVLSMGEDSTLILDSMVYQANQGVVEGAFTLASGLINFKSSGVTMAFTVRTPVADIGIRGTEFNLLADESRTEVSVVEGVVEVSSAGGTQSVFAGETYAVDGNGSAAIGATPSSDMSAAVQQMTTALEDTSASEAPDTTPVDEEAEAAIQQVRGENPDLDLSNILALEMAKGLILIEALPEAAPSHVERVMSLAKSGVYDGATFDFVRPGYAAEIGSATLLEATVSEAPLAQELSDQKFVRGAVGMSRPTGDPDGAIGAFFVALGDAPQLDQAYTVWGRVIYGMDVFDRLAPGRPPETPDAIQRLSPLADLLGD